MDSVQQLMCKRITDLRTHFHPLIFTYPAMQVMKDKKGLREIRKIKRLSGVSTEEVQRTVEEVTITADEEKLVEEFHVIHIDILFE